MKDPLKVLHISSLPYLSKIFKNFQPTSDCNVTNEVYDQKRGFSNIPSYQTDIIHLHGISLLKQTDILKAIENRQSHNLPVVFSLFKEHFWQSEEELQQTCLDNLELLKNCAALLMHDSETLNYLDAFDNCTWAGMPVQCDDSQISDTKYDECKLFKLLYFQQGGSSQTIELINSTVERLRKEQIHIDPVLLGHEDNFDFDTIYRLIEESDIYIDSLHRPSLSYLALLALSKGKATLANLPEKFALLTRQFDMSPILKTNENNLYYRLKSLISEPKSLRDFGRRGKKFVSDFHHPEIVCKSYLELYRQFAG